MNESSIISYLINPNPSLVGMYIGHRTGTGTRTKSEQEQEHERIRTNSDK